jgi:hypothetical protein
MMASAAAIALHRLGGLCAGSFGVAHAKDDVVSLGRKRPAKGFV